MTWEEIRDCDKSQLVAIAPIGATEAHGPHLPLSTDVIIAEAMARAGAEKLSQQGITPVVLPTLAYTSAAFAAGFAGTVSIRPETATALIVDIATGLARHGVRWFACANAHLDPSHIGSIDRALQALPEGICGIFPDVTKKPWALRLTDEFKSGACHAGCYEGSIVMAERPDLVRDAVQQQLPDNPHSLAVAIRDGKRSFEEAGGERAYFGYPASATEQEGQATIQTLGEILCEAVTQAIVKQD